MPSQMMLLAISTPFDRFLDPPELRVGGMKGVYAKLSVAERSGDLAPSSAYVCTQKVYLVHQKKCRAC